MRKILVVDDSSTAIELITDFISEELKSSFEIASNSQEAMAIIDNVSLSLIICDFEMPGGNGNEVLDYLVQGKRDVDFVYFSGKYDLVVEIAPPLIHTFTDKSYEKLFSFLSQRYINE